MLSILTTYWPAALAVALLLGLFYKYFNNGLNKYPGPWAANFTNIWRFADAMKGRPELTMIKLHRELGSVVRVGPNHVSLSDPEVVPRIFAINKGWVKSEAYTALTSRNNGKIIDNIFATRNEDLHSVMKRPIAGVYSQASLVGYEPLADDMIRLMMDRLQQEFGNGALCDMAEWLQYYAFDVILHLTFGNTMGFLESGSDAGGFMANTYWTSVESLIYYELPWLRWFARFNPIVAFFQKDDSIFSPFVRKQYQEHVARFNQAKVDNTEESLGQNGMLDFVYRFLALASEKPGYITPEMIFGACAANVNAGSDTTAVALRAVLYFLLKNPGTRGKLMDELRAADLSYPVTWKESQSLPYLHACIQEAFRLHPSVGVGLERVVPEGGCALPDGDVLPRGTVVSVNPWVIHRDEGVFGPNPDDYIPERWLPGKEESDDAFEQRMAVMKRTFLQFGWGKRVCLGRNISLLEIYKLVPTLLLQFDMQLASQEESWQVRNWFFVMQSNMKVLLKRRAQ